jgi:hypothetical protein
MASRVQPFDRATIEKAFERLGAMAVGAGKIVEISIYGGSALLLTLNQRPATKDVDAVFDKDRAFVRKAAALIADEFGWPQDWINDGVKGYLSRADTDAGAKNLFRSYPTGGPEGLRVLVASLPYLFAMKCLAMRAGMYERGNIEDIRELGKALSIGSSEQVLAVVARYYPLGRLPPKTQFGLEEIFGTNPP